jgi:hypothetical protein
MTKTNEKIAQYHKKNVRKTELYGARERDAIFKPVGHTYERVT